jgi:hypothetical protein
MIFNAYKLATLLPATADWLRTQRCLMAFNEIDQPNQANMTPEAAADTWAALLTAFPNAYLVSPCVAVRADVAGQPFDRFMVLLAQRNLRLPDAVAVHSYVGWQASKPAFNPVQQGLAVGAYCDRVYARYKLPVWLTEVGLVDWSTTPETYATVAENKLFLTTVAQEMDKRPFVERWAWFELPPGAGSYGLAVKSTGALTNLGATFASLPYPG